MNEQLVLKQKLFSLCEIYVNQKIQNAHEAIDNAQKSANKETKSSSGDKYETGRSMMQLEIEKYYTQLVDGTNLKKILNQINPNKIYSLAQTGSLIKTNQGNYFISISASKLIVDDIVYMAISFSSPIGQALFNRIPSDEINFKGKRILIETII